MNGFRHSIFDDWGDWDDDLPPGITDEVFRTK